MSASQPNPEHVLRIAQELGLKVIQVAATAHLLAGGATVPFIARYRKEATGTLDEVQVMGIRDRLEQLKQTDERRASILASLKERNLLTPELERALQVAETVTQLEDLYLPFRPRKRTRATIAKEKGLEPLAELVWAQDAASDPVQAASEYVGREYTPDDGRKQAHKIESVEEALHGARDILAERVSDDASAREKLRGLYRAHAILSSKVLMGREESGAKFKDYFDWSEPLAKAPSHRILAIRRGEKEEVLSMRVQLPDEEPALAELARLFVRDASAANRCSEQVRFVLSDAMKRLLAPAMETEMRIESKKRADQDAIKVFADNVRELLLAAPLGQRATLAIDPGFRTGCKVVLLDRQGKLVHNDVVYPDREPVAAREKLLGFVKFFQIEAIAIGNGTAGRETESFVRSLGLAPHIAIVMVNESGASIYSASEVAREEFPEHDLTVRGAVSIGRRLMDPLAELVKLDPKSIGVGQYQHDVDQSWLKRALDDTVMSSVNGVGVEVNTASKQLLSYVSGLTSSTAAAIVSRRNEKGPFTSRTELLEVARLGPKTFEQAAGFLRIRDAGNPLDASAVHPESYPIVARMAADLGVTVADLMRDASLRARIKLEKYVTETAGLPTLRDIMAELAKPGRDPREKFEAFSFSEGVSKPADLKPGMKLPGIVTNVTAFGAFVDVGVHQDGLVHVSQLADRFVSNAAEVVKPQQKVMVTVVEVDLARNRIALSMRSNPQIGPRDAVDQQGAPRNRPAGPGAARDRNRLSGGGGPRAGGGGGRPPASQQSVQGDWFADALKKKKR